MKQYALMSIAGLMLMTSGYENKSFFGAKVAPKVKPKEETLSEYKKSEGGTWHGKSNPVLYDGGFFARADFLYWRADEEGLEYAAKTNLQLSGAEIKGDFKSPSVRWNPAFRVGIGYTFNHHDFWDLAALWTHFQTTHSTTNSVKASSTDVLVPMWGSSMGSFGNSAQARWRLHYNVYDFDLGRNYFVSKTFAVHPFIGVRGATIEQNYAAKYNAAVDVFASTFLPTSFKAHTNFWGVGAHIGSGMQWRCSSSFSLVGNVGGSVLYGDFSIREKINTLAFAGQIATVQPFVFKEHLTTGAFNIEAMLGIAWEKCFYQDRYRLSIIAGYEWSEWFSQNRLMKPDFIPNANLPSGIPNTFDQQNGNLTLQGANLQVRWDF